MIRVRLGFAGEMFLAAKALKRVHCETPLPSGARVITCVTWRVVTLHVSFNSQTGA